MIKQRSDVMDNKRKNKRFDCFVPVDGKSGSLFDETKTVDIGTGGIGFVSSSKIPLNKRIAIELDISEEQEPVLVIGKVKWVHPISKTEQYRIGMTFERMLGGSISKLKECLQK